MVEDQSKVDSQASPYARWARGFLIAFHGFAALWGIFQIALPQVNLLELAFAVLFGFTITCWFRYDAMTRGQSILPVLQMLFFFLWPIAALVYLAFRSGYRGVLSGVAHGILAVVLVNLTAWLTFYSLHYARLLHT